VNDAYAIIMLGRKKTITKQDKNKVAVLFVDEMNDLQSQIAEHFLLEYYGNIYEVRSAGPKNDFVDCELISVMYQNGYDIRRATSKAFDAKNMIEYDYLIFLQKETYDRIRDVIPFKGKHILKDFGSRADFKATDDKELAECYENLTDRVKEWVKETFASPETLEKLVIK
jgi:protein-tyrosine-phosphatase